MAAELQRAVVEVAPCLLHKSSIERFLHGMLDRMTGAPVKDTLLDDGDMVELASILPNAACEYAPAMRSLANVPDIFADESALKTLMQSFGMPAVEAMMHCLRTADVLRRGHGKPTR